MNLRSSSVLIIEERVVEWDRMYQLLIQFHGRFGKVLHDFYAMTWDILKKKARSRAKVIGIRLSLTFKGVDARKVKRAAEWFTNQLRSEGILIWKKEYPRTEMQITIMFIIPTPLGSYHFTHRTPTIHISYRFIRAVEEFTGVRIQRRWERKHAR